jgi:hypothetical protein
VNDYTILKHKGGYTDGNTNAGDEAGTCILFSYVRDGILYQVLRLESISDKDSMCWNNCYITLSISEPTENDYLHRQVIDGIDRPGWVNSPGGEHSNSGFEVKLFRLFESLDKEDEQDYEEMTLETISKSGYAPTHQIKWKLPERDFSGVRGGAEIFVAALRLSPTGEISPSALPKPPSSQKLYATLGINPFSNMATGTMWETIFLWKDQRVKGISELNEVSLIARCMAKVLHVDTIPASLEGTSNKDSMVLWSNIFLRSGIDMQSLL